MNRKNYELKPMSIGDVLDYSIKVFISNFKSLSLLVVLIYLPWVFIYSLVIGKAFSNQASFLSKFLMAIAMDKDISDVIKPDMFDNSSLFVSISAQLINLLRYGYKLTIEPVFYAAIIRMIYGHIVKGKVYKYDFQGIKGLVRDCFKYLPRLMGYAALFYLILYIANMVFGIMAIAMFILTFAMLWDGTFSNKYILVFTVFLMIIVAFILLVAYVMTRIIFGVHAIVVEGYSVINSIKRSLELTKGNFWRIAPGCLFAAILFFMVGSLFSNLSAVFIFINQNLFTFMYVVSELLGAFMYPFAMVFLTVLFISIKIKKEGLDLEGKIDMLLNEIQDQDTEYNIINGESTDV